MISQDQMIYANNRNGSYPLIFIDEEFKQISSYIPEINNMYFISNYGRIYSVNINMIMSTQISNCGYEIIHLTTNKGSKVFSVHRLVAICFIPIENPEIFQVNHINGNKLNNHASNLEWVTQSENMIHCYRNNLEVNGEDHPWATISKETAIKICELLEQGYSNPDIAEIVFNNRDKYDHVNSIRIGSSWVNVSKNYNIPKSDRTNHFRKRFSNDELVKMYELLSSGLSNRNTAINMGIGINSMNEKDRERIYRVMRNLKNGTAYKYITRN